MSYIDSKRTRVYVHPTWTTEDGAPIVANLESEGWAFCAGIRNDQAQTTPNTQDQYHYGEESAVSTASPPSRTLNLPASEDLDDEGQSILRYAATTNEPIGVLVLKDGTNGYAVEASAIVNDESGDASGGLRSTGFTITPLSERVYVGKSGVYEPST